MKRLALFLSIAAACACAEPSPVKDTAPSAGTAAPPRAAAPSGAAQKATTTSPAAPAGKTPMTSAPLEIRLTATKGGLSAKMKNVSSSPQEVLHDAMLQPSELQLVGPGGSITPFDTRSIKKFDRTVYEDAYQTIAAGKEMDLFEAEVSGGQLVWGPYQFKNLAAGSYQATVVWTSAVDTYNDGGATKKKPGVWLGKVTSSTITLQVP